MLEFSTSERLYTLFYRCAHLMRQGQKCELGISPGQLRLLARINSMENPTQQKILENVSMRPASLSEMLTKLEKAGYIVRVRQEKDKRNVKILMTELGTKTVNENYEKQREMAISDFSVLSDEERQTLFEILRKLVNYWDNEAK